ncbi:advillin-like isoform X2 [Hydractinia symbiolongicarpus]|uniref:advillin-like isoform X2 n=1 Tax=Hydractinia symbiolongicarpus TaxID=13093 RepID=UPI00254BAB7E|nr:advillin-like isoform X2 [Hydractinia symbiolongicarpus]
MIVAGQQNHEPPKGMDPAFRGINAKAGLTVWRVENFGLNKLPEAQYGQFHDGDSYLVLQAEGRQSPYNYHVHFWLGKKTSQDEAGTAALKAVELDDVLGGAPTQYREIQHHESRRFVSYFPKGLKYAEGGVRSGFKKVEKQSRKRLLQVKGRKRPRVFEVPLHSDSLNRGDVFILDNGAKIWVWCGAESNRAERRKATEIARALRDNDRAGKSHVMVVDDDPMARPQKDNKNDSLSLFYSDLGSYGRIKPAGERGSDERVEREKMGNTTLHRVSDSSGQMRVTEIATGNLKYEMLDTADSFILDQGGTALYVWVGKKSTKEEKLQGMKVAVNFLRSKKYPDYTQVTMVKQGSELSLFKQCFVNWPQAVMNFQNKTYHAGRGIAQVQQTKFDAATLHQRQKRQDEKMFDDGNGKIDIWRVENFKLVPQPKEMLGTFFGGDCYVILYTYQKNKKEMYLIYYWLGLDSTADEQGTAAAMTVKMDDSLGGAAVQIRVVQGKEPEHFLKIFKGKMIVYRGGKSSGFRGHQAEVQQSGIPRLFQVRGMGADKKKALEVEAVAASLNSNDVFVLLTPREGFLWYGKGCSGDERELGKELAARIAPRFAEDFTKVLENKEPAEFWDLLGGPGEYSSGHYFEQEIPEYPPRLFLCSNASGRFEVEEIFNFTQSDMEYDDIMLLDTHDSIFIWVGKDSNTVEKKEAMRTAIEYVKSDPAGRDPDRVQIMVVKQGFEPPQMTGCFPSWDDNVFAHGKSYEELKRELNDENAGVTFVQEELSKFSFDRKYPLKVLQQEEVPEGVDPTRKEYYLSPEEFHEVFGMSLNQYEGIPQWKKDILKKKFSLF